jgi:hypothetical protein
MPGGEPEILMPLTTPTCRSLFRHQILSRPPRALAAGVALAALAATLAWSAPAPAAELLPPGGERILTSVDGGSSTCRRGTQEGGSTFFDCLGSGTLGTHADPGDNFVRARSHASLTPLSFGTAIGIPNYATARLYRDVEVAGGPTDGYVPVEISALFDYKNFFFLGAAYVASSGVSLQVVDLASGAPVASATLFQTDRDGDQGFTDVALANQRLVVPGASGDLRVLLKRGRTYRLVFELEVMSQVLAVGVVEADASATLTSLTVRVDEDELEELVLHDGAVRSQLATHDLEVKALLAELREGQEELKANQREIIRLLLTPQGQRESQVIGGEWPLRAPGKLRQRR